MPCIRRRPRKSSIGMVLWPMVHMGFCSRGCITSHPCGDHGADAPFPYQSVIEPPTPAWNYRSIRQDGDGSQSRLLLRDSRGWCGCRLSEDSKLTCRCPRIDEDELVRY